MTYSHLRTVSKSARVFLSVHEIFMKMSRHTGSKKGKREFASLCKTREYKQQCRQFICSASF